MNKYCFVMLYTCMAVVLNPERSQGQAWLNDGLVAYFPFNGSADDESGNGHHGQVNGALLASGVNGDSDSAYLFSQDPLRTITGTGIDLANSSLTVSFWLKKERRPGEESMQQGWTVTLGQVVGGGATGKNLLFTMINGGQTISFDFFNDQLHVNSPGIGEANWSHVVGTWDKQTRIRCVYIDGVLSGTDTSNGYSGTGDFLFQAHGSQVLLDEIRFYNRVITPAQVQVLHEQGNQLCTPRRARAKATMETGSVIGATIRDYGCGYTNAPLVLIRGGGGNGAAGYATIEDGRVTGIVITNAGCCYTGTPRIEIASPPFEPSLTVAVSKVNVIQKIVLGRNYILQSSDDLIQWTPVGTPFTAESESVTNEFSVENVGRHFRLQEVR